MLFTSCKYTIDIFISDLSSTMNIVWCTCRIYAGEVPRQTQRGRNIPQGLSESGNRTSPGSPWHEEDENGTYQAAEQQEEQTEQGRSRGQDCSHSQWKDFHCKGSGHERPNDFAMHQGGDSAQGDQNGQRSSSGACERYHWCCPTLLHQKGTEHHEAFGQGWWCTCCAWAHNQQFSGKAAFRREWQRFD